MSKAFVIEIEDSTWPAVQKLLQSRDYAEDQFGELVYDLIGEAIFDMEGQASNDSEVPILTDEVLQPDISIPVELHKGPVDIDLSAWHNANAVTENHPQTTKGITNGSICKDESKAHPDQGQLQAPGCEEPR